MRKRAGIVLSLRSNMVSIDSLLPFTFAFHDINKRVFPLIKFDALFFPSQPWITNNATQPATYESVSLLFLKSPSWRK